MTLNADALYSWLSAEGHDPEFLEDDTEIAICCPTCNDDKPRLYVGADSGAWICFHCGAQGNLVGLLKGLLGDFDEAFELRRKWTRDEAPDPFEHVGAARSTPKPAVSIELPDEFRPLEATSPAHFVKYLQKRGVPLELAQARGVGYCLEGYYRYRIILPVVNDEYLYTFVARTILVRCPSCGGRIATSTPAAACMCERPIPKVLTPQGGTPRQALYNLDAVRHAGGQRVVVVEGVFDALRLPDEAVALLGSSPSPTQISLLAGVARGRDVIVCLDGDSAGRGGAAKVADGLASAMVRVRVAHLAEGQDPGSLSRLDLQGVLTAATRHVL